MPPALADPMISTRISLAWPPAPPDELTDTLVLTGRSGSFIDLRVFVNGDQLGKIDWATAGLKTWTEDSTPEQPKALFTSYIDSRRSTRAPPPEPDIGLFAPPLPNGDVLETGSMPNPLSSDPHTPVPYEEIWRRLPLPPAPAVRATFLRSEGPGGLAFIGRVGRYQLGTCGAEADFYWFYARRSEWVNGEWRETRCVGGEPARQNLPLVPDGLVGAQGDEVALGHRVWVVLENS